MVSKVAEPVVVAEHAQRVEAARVASAEALADVVRTVRILEAELKELARCESDVRAVRGWASTLYPSHLAAAVASALSWWAKTPEGSAALNVPPPPTYQEQVLINARFDLAALERNLADARAVVPLDDAMVDGRRRRIENASLAVVAARRRVASLEGGSALEQFKKWVRGFTAEIQGVLRESPAFPRGGGARREVVEAWEAREFAAEHPLAALAAELEREG